MKTAKTLTVLLFLVFFLTACGTASPYPNAVNIVLSDNGVTADGTPVGTDTSDAVYIANDIVYYESGKDFTYGEGTEQDAHTSEEADTHTVVHITKPGVYALSGVLSRGQIAVDLGDSAKDDPEAVVTLLLNGVEITCEVAPGVIFYNVYECGDGEAENAAKDVDTSAAGANVIIADGTVNTVSGSYVARIYKPDSVVLNSDKTEVEDAKKLHKYDGAFYSKMSLNITDEKDHTGVLNIHAENEGLDSEMHLTVNGGNINIFSGNDGINTNEDGISVTTVNGGCLTIEVTGTTGEGDGIDSNGWLVINGGTVIASACAVSGDAGIDSDMGIHINGGTVIASGNMLDRIADSRQNYAVFNFAEKQPADVALHLKNSDGEDVLSIAPPNAYSILIYSSPDLPAGTYTLWSEEEQLVGQSGNMFGGMGKNPGAMNRPEGERPTDGFVPPEGERPTDGFTPPEGERPTDGFTPPEGEHPFPGGSSAQAEELTAEFILQDGANIFSSITKQK